MNKLIVVVPSLFLRSGRAEVEFWVDTPSVKVGSTRCRIYLIRCFSVEINYIKFETNDKLMTL